MERAISSGVMCVCRRRRRRQRNYRNAHCVRNKHSNAGTQTKKSATSPFKWVWRLEKETKMLVEDKVEYNFLHANAKRKSDGAMHLIWRHGWGDHRPKGDKLNENARNFASCEKNACVYSVNNIPNSRCN